MNQSIVNDSAGLHIASLVIWVGDKAKELQCQLNSLSWADCPIEPEKGKCVAVLEAVDDKQLIERIDWVRDLPDVLSAQLVYHAFEENDL